MLSVIKNYLLFTCICYTSADIMANTKRRRDVATEPTKCISSKSSICLLLY